MTAAAPDPEASGDPVVHPRADTLERRCRHLLRAWPSGDRLDRGNELVGTLLDVIPANRSWPPMLVAVDFVLNGLRVRVHRHPPLGAWLRYRNGGRIDGRWLPWMVDDLCSRRRWLRVALVPALLGGIVLLAISLSIGTPWYRAWPIPGGLALGQLVGGRARQERHRTQAILRHLDLLGSTVVARGHWDTRRALPVWVLDRQDGHDRPHRRGRG